MVSTWLNAMNLFNSLTASLVRMGRLLAGCVPRDAYTARGWPPTLQNVKQPLTPNQHKVLAFIEGFLAEEDRFPTTREIQAVFGFDSQTAVMSYMRALERKGWLESRHDPRKKNGWWRFAR